VIDGVAKGIESTFLYSLAEGKVGLAPVSAQFDDKAGLGSRNEIARKGEVT
jgi:hypothetical protein